MSFNGHPPLGVNATCVRCALRYAAGPSIGFNGHPPLGVNATAEVRRYTPSASSGFNGHPPLGVNATIMLIIADYASPLVLQVSTGTHPWG